MNIGWTDMSAIGYPTLFLGVLLGSIVPIVPTGAVVGAAAAVAMTTPHLSLPLVLLIATVAAMLGDVLTYAIARLGSEAAVRWFARGERPERLENMRERLGNRGWQLIVVGRLVPAGRIPVLLAAGAVAYPWRRLLPSVFAACLLWAVAYALLGVLSGGLFDSPLIATLLAAALVLVVTVGLNLIARHRRRKGKDMTTHGPGRLVRGGRHSARVLLVWAAVIGTLYGLDVLLPGFSMTSWWQPVVCALLLGLLTSVVWPLVLRVALPLALFTLGIGSYLLLGAATLALFTLVPGVRIDGLRTGVFLVLGVTLITAVVSSLLSVDQDELYFRRAARRSKRGPDLGRVPPGVIFLQVDGLGYDVARRAIRDGDMPTLARWLAEDSHTLRRWQTDWSSQTGASVCGILHGSNENILGFRWYEKDRDHVMGCAHPADAVEIERRHSDGRGLLAEGGASHGNLFTGDAPHVSFTLSAISVLLPRKLRGHRTDRMGSGYYSYFANPANAVRTFFGYFAEVGREIIASTRQRRADVRPRVHRGGFYPFARAGATVIARDVVVHAILDDMLAGRPVVYADLLGYDEVAHHSGIERHDSLAVLREIDRHIGRLYRASKLGPRPYHLVVLSDHGQTQGQHFAERFGEPVEEFVGRCAGGQEGGRPDGPVSSRLRERARDRGHIEHSHPDAPGAVRRVAPGVVACASGHMAMVSFTEFDGRVPMETIEAEYPKLLPALVDHPGIGFVLVRSSEHGPVVLGRDGAHRLATGVVLGSDPLAEYGEHAPELVRRVDGFDNCADIMINSRYDPETDDAPPFEPHVGSHGGLGGPQEGGFLVYPKEFTVSGELVGAESLHRLFRSWIDGLGHPAPVEEQERAEARVAG
ncbi:VTT domain-containing protein [Sciscionella sediminilitoris]|uniref:VTT domain-containing protein n=1 Tax=Sciscionella sediminilitoris TaxID=1445613 RepID=UPI0009EC6347